MRRRRRDLDHMVEALLAGAPLPQARLEPEEVDVLRAAIELRAARPGADVPDEGFVTGLRHRLSVETNADVQRTRAGIPRRALLAGAAGAVAAGLVGAVAEATLSANPAPTPAASGELAPDDGEWVRVAAASDVTDGQVKRFATATTVGFVTDSGGTVSAVSGACTHQGCLLQVDEAAGRLDCPCHRTAFSVDGTVVFSRLKTQPAPLPRIQVRKREGHVEAFLPRQV